jgi:phenylalanyl-tRNA synthetase beta chain
MAFTMLYSKNLLKHYLSLNINIQDIADALTLKVCEVEEIHERILPDLVVIGKVTDVSKHPNADTLLVCQLDCGDKGRYQICTGGENVVADSRVAVALPGCYLPSINLTIEEREMRGEASNGMICSKAELGIPEDVDEHWIWTLQYGPSHDLAKVTQTPDMDDLTDADLGVALGEKYPWLNNWTMDIENKTITHRPDLFGHFGIANELATIFAESISFDGAKKYREQLQEPMSIYQILDNSKKTSRGIDMRTDKVHTYTLLELNNVNRQTSDLYLRALLYDLGLQPRANWVDFSNVFMYLTGQPVHFFDAAKVSGDIIVRQAESGEQFTDLFETTHTLTEDDIVIADNEKVLALAGVVGSNNS